MIMSFYVKRRVYSLKLRIIFEAAINSRKSISVTYGRDVLVNVLERQNFTKSPIVTPYRFAQRAVGGRCVHMCTHSGAREGHLKYYINWRTPVYGRKDP
jgi:hypothetical protein